MNIYGPLRVSLFMYESFRLMIMVGVFASMGTLQETPEGVFPYVVYVVPNALFPLMTYFLWIRLALYKSYIALYIAGKTIAVVSIIGWAVFSFPLIISVVTAGLERSSILLVGITLTLAAMDGLSIFGGLTLNNKLNRLESEPESLKEED